MGFLKVLLNCGHGSVQIFLSSLLVYVSWRLESLARILPAGKKALQGSQSRGPGSSEKWECGVTLRTDSQPTEKFR